MPGRRNSGQVVFEFVLMIPFYVLFLLLLVDFGLLMYGYVSAANAAREGARFAAVRCQASACTVGDIQQRTVDRAGGFLTTANVSVDWVDRGGGGFCPNASDAGTGDSVVVKALSPHSFLFFTGATFDVVACADMRLELDDCGQDTTGGTGC